MTLLYTSLYGDQVPINVLKFHYGYISFNTVTFILQGQNHTTASLL